MPNLEERARSTANINGLRGFLKQKWFTIFKQLFQLQTRPQVPDAKELEVMIRKP
jgi:hypothetical protein